MIDESNSLAIETTDSEIFSAMKKLAKTEVIMQSPEGAATYAALSKLVDSGFVSPPDSIMLFRTESRLVYPEFWLTKDFH